MLESHLTIASTVKLMHGGLHWVAIIIKVSKELKKIFLATKEIGTFNFDLDYAPLINQCYSTNMEA